MIQRKTVMSGIPARTAAARRIVEVMGPQRLSLRERVEHARQSMEGAALERLRRDVEQSFSR